MIIGPEQDPNSLLMCAHAMLLCMRGRLCVTAWIWPAAQTWEQQQFTFGCRMRCKVLAAIKHSPSRNKFGTFDNHCVRICSDDTTYTIREFPAYTCMGMIPSQANMKLAQLPSRTTHNSTMHSAKNTITITRSLSCSTNQQM